MATIPDINAGVVKALREDREWTQAELASALGCSQPTVCRIERGGKVSRLYRMLILDLLSRDRQAA